MKDRFEVSKFMGQLTSGGALASLFSVKFALPGTGWGHGKTGGIAGSGPYRCKTASFPSSTIATTEVAYMGRTVTVPGNREAQQITTEFYNDEGHMLRADILKWMDNINGHSTNKRKKDALGYISYRGTLTIEQWTKDKPTADTPANAVTIHNAWPSEVAEISLDWETNEIQTFEVTWEFSHWTQSAGNVGVVADTSSTDNG